MKLVATKLEMETVGMMSKLVIENVDAIASDLTILDSRLLLGNANIDVVALDGTNALVLIAIDRTSDEQLLLKAVEAYSWCLEYPEAVRRLYPAADVSLARPPRVMFVVERMSDSFHRKVKQLGFPEVDCVEFRHLAIDGAEVIHFETIVRLRRPTVVTEDTRPGSPAPASTPAPDHAVVETTPVARATGVKLQKLLSADTPSPSTFRQVERSVERPLVERPAAPMAVSAPAPAREPGVVVSMMKRAGRHAAARLEEAALSSALPGIAPAAKQPVIPSSRRSLRDAEPLAMPVETTTLEPAAVMAPVLDIVVEPQPIAAPEPVAVAPVVVERQPIEPVIAIKPVAVKPQLIAAPEPVVAPARELKMELPPIAVAPVLEAVAEPQPIAIEPIVAVAPVPEPVVEPQPITAPAPVVAVTPVAELVMEPEIVVAVAPVSEPVVKPEPVAAPEPLAVAPAIEPIVKLEPIVAPEPVVAAAPVIEPIVKPAPIAAPAPVPAAPELPRISFADLSKELLAATSVERKPVAAPKPVAPTRPLEPPVSIRPAAVAGSPERVSLADLSKELLGTPVRTPQANGPTPKRLQVPPVVEPPKVVETTRTILEQIESAQAEPVLEIAPSMDVEAAAQVPESAAEAADEKVQDLPQGFEGLKFPGDGVLTRQWMDFLNQMTATK
jgi:hypothetical protein